MLQKIADVENYWWSAGNWNNSLKPSIGLFSCCSYSGGIQNELTRAPLENCVPHYAHKLLTDVDNMFYVIGATATHNNYGKSDVMEELPFLSAAKFFLDTSAFSYSSFCDIFNDMVGNLKSKVFKRIKKFYE